MEDTVRKFEEFETAGHWKEAYECLPEMLRANSENAEAWVRALYFLHNLVLEVMGVQDTGVFYDEAKDRLLDYFRQANAKFSDNAEYLFFMGIIGHVAEYYWGEDDDAFAWEMSRKAFKIETSNKLYEWGSLDVRQNKKDCERKVLLSQEMLANSSEKAWLQSKGFPGQYVLRVQKYDAQFICTDEEAINPLTLTKLKCKDSV
jgi:hypothetical protein